VWRRWWDFRSSRPAAARAACHGLAKLWGPPVPALAVRELQSVLALRYVPLEVVGDHRHHVGRDRHVPNTGIGLRAIGCHHPSGPDDAPPYMNHSGLKVEVLASELEHLPVPQRARGAQLYRALACRALPV